MSWVREMIEAGANFFQHFISGVLGGGHPEALSWRILLTALAIGLLFLFIVIGNRLLRRLDATLESWRGTRIQPIRVQTFELLSADRLTDTLKWLVRKFRLVVWLVGLYIFIPLILTFLPPDPGAGHPLSGLPHRAHLPPVLGGDLLPPQRGVHRGGRRGDTLCPEGVTHHLHRDSKR